MLHLPGAVAMITFNKIINTRDGKLKGFVVEKKKQPKNIPLSELEKVRQKTKKQQHRNRCWDQLKL